MIASEAFYPNTGLAETRIVFRPNKKAALSLFYLIVLSR